MAGTIRTYQKCRVCGVPYGSSKGMYPIECCQTFPTKFYIRIKGASLYRNCKGNALRDWISAQTALREMQSRVDAGTFEAEVYKRQSKTAFRVFWKQFVKRYKNQDATLSKLNAIYAHLAPFHDRQMRDIKAHMIDDWWTELECAPRYKNDILVWLKSFLKYAAGLDIIEKVPYPMPRAIEIQANEIDFHTESEQLEVLQHIPEYDRPIFDFLFLTGVRVNEACGLYRSDVDWDRGVVWIKRTVKRDKTVGPVKNKKIRPIPLVSVKHCFVSSKVAKFSKYRFVNKWGRRYTDDYLRDTFYRACDELGIKRIQLKNATRHSFGMGLLRKGYDIWQVSKAMNHSTIRMTENYVAMLGGEIENMYGRGNQPRDGTGKVKGSG